MKCTTIGVVVQFATTIHPYPDFFGTAYPDFPSDPNKRGEGGRCGGRKVSKGLANVVSFAAHNI